VRWLISLYQIMNQYIPSTHLLLDFWGVTVQKLINLAEIEQVMREAAIICGATVIGVHLHKFSPEGGITGVAILAESHISIHTWPEINYAAIDVFMCGECNASLAIPVLKAHFQPETCKINTIARGLK
jgi:S-adenosylmethionine decarboxylase